MKTKPLSNLSFYIEILKAEQNIYFFGVGKAYYRDINLYFVYDTQNKQWFSSGPKFFNEAICEKVRNKNFNLKAFARKYYYVEKKGNGYAIDHILIKTKYFIRQQILRN